MMEILVLALIVVLFLALRFSFIWAEKGRQEDYPKPMAEPRCYQRKREVGAGRSPTHVLAIRRRARLRKLLRLIAREKQSIA